MEMISRQVSQNQRLPSRPLAALPIAPQIIARLREHGVLTLKDWRELGARRHQIFGVTSAIVAQLDVAAAAESAEEP